MKIGNGQPIPMDKILLVQEEPRGPSMLIETPITNNGTSQLALPLVQQLQTSPDQTVIIKGIRLVTAAELTNSPTLGNPVAPLTELQKISLILYSNGWEKGQLIPLLSLNNTFTEGSGIPWRDKSTKLANWKAVDWNKSKFVYSNGTVSAGSPYDIVLEVEYIRFDANGNVVDGPPNS